MTKDVTEIQNKLLSIQKSFLGPLRIKVDTPTNCEFTGTIPAQQGKQKVDGHYFSSIMPKAKDVRLYFFPAYTHASSFENLSETLQKFKKGKSCFHVKFLDETLEKEIQEMTAKGVELYQKDGLLSK